MKKQLLSILKSDLARSSSIIFASIFSSNLILFLANIYISKIFGPENFGIFKTILYFFSFFAIMTDVGINFTLTKYIAEFRNRKKEKIGYMVKWFLKIKFLVYIILVILFLIFRNEIAILFLKDVSLSYLIIPGILLTFFTFFMTFQAIVLGFQKFKFYAGSQFLNLVTSSILGVLMLPFGIFYVILGWSLGPLVGNIFNIKFFWKKKIIKKIKEFDIKAIFLKFSIPMFLTNIIFGLSNLIIPLLSLFFSVISVGYFSFAFIFYNAVLLIPTSLSIVLFPKVSELNGLKRHSDAKNLLKKAFIFYSLTVLAGFIFLVFFSQPFITFISKEYLPSLPIFMILTFLGLIFGYNIIYTNYLKGLGKIKEFALLILIQNILLFVVSFILLELLKL